MRLLLSSCFIILLTTSQALFAASVWQVSKDDQSFYLVGTVHLLSESDFPLPAAFDTAFNASNHLIFETNLADLTSPKGMNLLMSQNTYKPGQNLQQVLSKEVYQQLQSKAAERQWPLTSIEQFKPAFAAIMLATLELQRLGAASTGVDMHYLQLAQQQQKTYGGLETLDEHLGVMTALNKLDADSIISATLKDLAQTETMLAQMKAAWRSGDTDALETLFLADMKAFPDMYNIMLVDRNHAWMKTLEQLTEPGTMVLVGALHMVGDDGLLKLLTSRGYTIKQLVD
ncbi:TraB/GumN family protein [Alishewanella longhuensis]|uniref:TraB/GumN family protein n=1 Tax=Alishewanella longhuensis TaxID=1091037 RepID=A0ABQ3KW36_9ALTE|nr:TraB/GumN family protein [Alishewanella longhuensis]GHG64061.1 TraB/GumN family protein [Alishewanella longhuensis]